MNILAMTCTELAAEMNRRYGKGAYHAAALYRELFKKGNTALTDIPEFSNTPALASQIQKDVFLPSCRIIASQEDGVIKFASQLEDGKIIESVIIPADGRTTLCVSSQVGCKMGCSFCATGSMGFVRNLGTEEIVWQAYAARFLLGWTIDNIVFMGMGEPLDNLDSTIQAVHVMSDQRGLDIAHRHITVSTVGHLDGLRRLSKTGLKNLRLALSLHAATDELRSQLMPVNNRYPLALLKEELQQYPLGRNGVIFIEYVLLSGVNDSFDQAKELARFLEGLPVRVNVIAYNGGSMGAFEAPSADHVERFCKWLRDMKIFASQRQSRGQKIMAACGQLGSTLSGRRHNQD